MGPSSALGGVMGTEHSVVNWSCWVGWELGWYPAGVYGDVHPLAPLVHGLRITVVPSLPLEVWDEPKRDLPSPSLCFVRLPSTSVSTGDGWSLFQALHGAIPEATLAWRRHQRWTQAGGQQERNCCCLDPHGMFFAGHTSSGWTESCHCGLSR